MMPTKSELLFERLCTAKRILWQKIPEGKMKTPDYELKISPVNLLVEVKQLDENDEDRIINAASLQDKDMPAAECPSDRVRQKIAEAYRQLKAHCRTGLGTGLVLYNNAGRLTFIDCWTVIIAMFGNYGFRIGMPISGGAIVTTGAGFMGHRKVTRNTCRALSFVAVLQDDLSFEIYHNPFATVSLEPSSLTQLATAQFIHDNPHEGKYVPWEPRRIET
jgi:hypothetical protein